MRRSHLVTSVLAGLLAAAFPVVSATQSPPVPLLWKVSDKDNSVYLLGSFHMLRANDYPLSPDVDAALADAETVVFELPPAEILSADLGTQMLAAAVRTDGTTLDSELPPGLARRLRAWTEQHATSLRNAGGATYESMQMLEPWFVALLITIVEAHDEGFDSKLGLDAHLAAAAEDAGKRTAGLESGAQQLAMLDGMTRAQQIQMLEEALTEDAKGKEGFDSLHGMWRRGDVAALWDEMGTKMRREYPDLYKRINTERNDTWVPKLVARLQAPGTDDTLVVVGSLHLLGNDGVVEKLKKQGYKVERICSACAK